MQIIDRVIRLKAFDCLREEFQKNNLSRKEIINRIHNEFDIPVGTIYGWYNNTFLPYGRKGRVLYGPELLYVLGALLGDGCIYNWKITNNYAILVGDYNFATKYAKMLAVCTTTKTKPYIDRSKNIWFVRSNNFELYSLFKKLREDLKSLMQLIDINNGKYPLSFIEGFFDAEGCVKVIKEKTRRTPKICLDITNTNLGILELIRELLQEKLGIVARYSLQKSDPTKNKKLVYHLRIYKKDYVKIFFENLDTIKLSKEKDYYLKVWLKK